MQLGMIGLGRMGGNIVRRLMRDGHHCVVYDNNPAAVLALGGEGAVTSQDLADLVRQLSAPRAVWVMLPSGAITEAAVTALGDLLSAGDVIIDGGNSNYKDDVRRAQELAGKGIRYIDYNFSFNNVNYKYRYSYPQLNLTYKNWQLDITIYPYKVLDVVNYYISDGINYYIITVRKLTSPNISIKFSCNTIPNSPILLNSDNIEYNINGIYKISFVFYNNTCLISQKSNLNVSYIIYFTQFSDSKKILE